MFDQDAEVVARKGDSLTVRVRKPGACCACSLLCSFPRRDATFTLNGIPGTFHEGQAVKIRMSSKGTMMISFCLFVVPSVFFLAALLVGYSVWALPAAISFVFACAAGFAVMLICRGLLERVPAWYSVNIIDKNDAAY